MSILVVGSVAYDDVETPSERRKGLLGGSATNFSYAASFFSPVRLVGIVGDDFKQEDIDVLEGAGIDLDGLKTESGKTFAYGCVYEKDMNIRKTIFTDLNVFADFEPILPDSYKKSDVVFLANIHPELQHQVLDQIDYPRLVGADSMNLWIDTALDSLMRLLKRIDILVINDEEAKMLTGEIHLPKAARELLKMGPSRLIIKRGEFGVAMFSEDGTFFAPAFPVSNVVDPTGAGDCFAGGLIGYLARQKRLDEPTMRLATVYGSVMASFAVEKFSFNRLKSLTRKEIEDRLEEFRKLTTF